MNRQQKIETMAHLVCEMANKPNSCKDCPGRRGGCFTIPKMEKLADNALIKGCDECAGCTQWKCDCLNIKVEAYEEFAERLKSFLLLNHQGEMSVVSYEDINNLLKELKRKITGEIENANSSI